MFLYLFKIDTFTTGIRSSQNFHAPSIFVKYCVIWNKQADTELLQRVPEENKTNRTLASLSFQRLQCSELQ